MYNGTKGAESLTNFAKDLMAKKHRKVDVILGNKRYDFSANNYERQPRFHFEDEEVFTGTDSFVLNDVSSRQVATKLGIPFQYWNKMAGAETLDLLEDSVNFWTRTLTDPLMFRLFLPQINTPGISGTCRAVLSPSYKQLENEDYLVAILQVCDRLRLMDRMAVTKCEISNTKMYVEIVDPALEMDAPNLCRAYRKDHRITTGISFGNSEVGHGAYFMEPIVHVLACSNGLVIRKDGMRHRHVGKKKSEGESFKFSNKIHQMESMLDMAKMIETAEYFLSTAYRDMKIEEANAAAAEQYIRPQQEVKNICEKLSFGKVDTEDILNTFIRNGDNSRMGIAQAITELAQGKEADVEYDWKVAAGNLIFN